MLNDFIDNGQLYSPDESGAPADGNATEGNTQTTNTTTETNTQTSTERTFTQSELDSIIDKRLERERKKVDAEVQARLAKMGMTPEEAEEYHKLKEEKEDIARQKEEAAGNYQQAKSDLEKKFSTDLAKEREEAATWKGKYETYYTNDQLTTAGLKVGANPDSIEVLVKYAEENIRVQPDGTLQVVDYRGEVRHEPDDPSQDMKVESLLGEILRKFPNLQKSSGSSGAGSNSSRGTNGYTKEQILDYAKNNIPKYKELKEDGTVDAVLNSD